LFGGQKMVTRASKVVTRGRFDLDDFREEPRRDRDYLEAARAELRGMGGSGEFDWRQVRAMIMEREGQIITADQHGRLKRKRKKTHDTPGRVSAANRALLQRQNPALANETMWAHSVPFAEQGGLMVRMPMELQLWHIEEYREILEKRLDERTARSLQRALHKSDGMWRVMDDSQKVVQLYTVAEDYLKDRMKKVYLQCQVGGSDVKLPKHDLNLLELYQSYMDTWQQVVFLTRYDKSRRTPTKGIVINRPTSTTCGTVYDNPEGVPLTPKLERWADLLENQVVYAGSGLVESKGEGGGSAPGMPKKKEKKRRYQIDPKLIPKSRLKERKRRIRERQMRSRHGGLDLTMIHQYRLGVRFQAEILPSNVYEGDMESICDTLDYGNVDPGHIRIFQGSKTWAPGELEKEMGEGLWYSVAASRNMVLKHCIGLPKPLWHEVMELAGGGLLEASELEIRKKKEAGGGAY